MNSKIHFIQINHKYIYQVKNLLEEVFSYTPHNQNWSNEDLEEITDFFPEGSILAIDLNTDQVVGIGLGVFLELDLENLPDNEDELVGIEEWNHDPLGSYYYGIDMAVHPAYRGKNIARRIYDYRKGLIVKKNKRGLVAAAAIPGYENEKHRMSAKTYIEQVINNEIFDPTLSVQLRNDFKVLRPLKKFFYHSETNHMSALIYWENKQFNAKYA